MDRLSALRAYLRVVELGSFSAAARSMGIGQPTVSKWVAALEDTLAVQLLHRTTRAMVVTDAGERFATHAREVLAAWDEAVGAAGHARGRLSGRLRVSVPVVYGQRRLLPHLTAWAERHPALALDVSFSDGYVDLIGAGVDLAVRVGRPVDSSHRARLLVRSARRLVAAPRYLERHGRPSTPADLAAHACLVHRGLDTRATWVLRRGEVAHPVEVDGRLCADNSAALASWAEAGLGIALLADWLVDEAIAAGRLEALLPDHALPPAPVRAVWPATRYVPTRVRAFVDFLAERLGGEPGA